MDELQIDNKNDKDNKHIIQQNNKDNKQITQNNKDEKQYLDLIRDVLTRGYVETTRNGQTISLFGCNMRFSLAGDTIPLLTTKKLAWKTCLKELLFFIHGETDNQILINQGVNIWTANQYPGGTSLGKIYGYQWRHFNKPDIPVEGQYYMDQLQFIIDELKDPRKRTSRRLILTAYNPNQLGEMCLPPCHVMCQFNVHGGDQLSCLLFQRSGDIGLGVPFNIASYAFLTHLLAKHCGLQAYELIHTLGNAHIYMNHVELLREQITRTMYDFPKIKISPLRANINDYTVSDFEIINYVSHPAITMAMTV